jgi:hypothetical protein
MELEDAKRLLKKIHLTGALLFKQSELTLDNLIKGVDTKDFPLDLVLMAQVLRAYYTALEMGGKPTKPA